MLMTRCAVVYHQSADLSSPSSSCARVASEAAYPTPRPRAGWQCTSRGRPHGFASAAGVPPRVAA
eukprot:12255524-Alexandrium_andersonii.AAC.1